MVKNPEILRSFELKLEKEINNTYPERLRIFESMLEFKNSIIRDEKPLEGIDEKIEIIKRLHSVK